MGNESSSYPRTGLKLVTLPNFNRIFALSLSFFLILFECVCTFTAEGSSEHLQYGHLLEATYLIVNRFVTNHKQLSYKHAQERSCLIRVRHFKSHDQPFLITLLFIFSADKYESAYWSADVIFLLDSSGFVLAKNLILEKNFVKLMARLLNLEKNRTRAALFAFGDNPELQISFDGYEDREAFDAAVNTVPHLQGNRHIDKAFQSAADLLRSKSRPTVPSYVVLLTTGTQTLESDTRSLVNASQEIRKYGGRIFVVAVLTDGYKISDFYATVQRPEDAFSLSSFVELLPRAPSIAARMIASWSEWKFYCFCCFQEK